MATNQVNNIVINALKAAATYAARIEELRAALPRGLDKSGTADALRPGVASFYGMRLEVKSTGREVFPVDHAQSENARRALSRLVRAVMGDAAAHAPAPTVRIKSAERSAYAALLDACGGDVKRLAAVVKALRA